MDELKKLLQAMQEKFEQSQEGRIKAEKDVESKIKALDEKWSKLEQSQDGEEIKKLHESIATLEDEISDVRTKAASTFKPTGDEHEAVKTVVRKALGGLLKAKGLKISFFLSSN